MSIKLKSILWGLIAGLAMALFYASIMLFTMGASGAKDNFLEFWHLLSVIIIGFGAQAGLWVYLRYSLKYKRAAAASGVSAAASGTAMFACCAHHAADLLPLAGLAGAAVFLADYQRPLLVLGASINLLGIVYMLKLLRKHGVSNKAVCRRDKNNKRCPVCGMQVSGDAVMDNGLSFCSIGCKEAYRLKKFSVNADIEKDCCQT